MGNKSKFLAEITTEMRALTPRGSTVVDLFAGSGVVTRALGQLGPVVSADIQAYSSVLVSALCNPFEITDEQISKRIEAAESWIGDLGDDIRPLLDYEEDAILKSNDDPRALALLAEGRFSSDGLAGDSRLSASLQQALPAMVGSGATIAPYYGGSYFSFRQALELDAISATTPRGKEAASNTVIASLLGAASNSVASVGNHFAQPTRVIDARGTIKKSAIRSVATARKASIFQIFGERLRQYRAVTPTLYQCDSMTGDYRSILTTLPGSVDAIYADPPYTRDHYSRFYHILETLALGDDPGVTSSSASSTPSRGLYRKQRHQSPFSIRSQAHGAFDELYRLSRGLEAPVVLSYSPRGPGTQARPETRLLSIEEIEAIAGRYYRSVDLKVIDGSSHSRFNLRRLNSEPDLGAEVMVIATL
ncbi:DNA adenine methylase [Rathayibacter sp. AY1F3]|uniref:DNA adenine methylase n=1 Tax=Rathayibacter sp. AY1F3 TaxID=2080558 RepID=UPI0021571710|nr:DNA adenine methylase [Rathayibacter sp. AY1F3]